MNNCYIVVTTNMGKETKYFPSVESAGLYAYARLTAIARYPRKGYTDIKGNPVQPVKVWVYNDKDQPVERMWITGNDRGKTKVMVESYTWEG